MLRFIKKHTQQVKIPQKGRFQVNSFLACRPFRLVFDLPSGLAEIEYFLDDLGRLNSIKFSPLNRLLLPGEISLRVYTAATALTVKTATKTFSLGKSNSEETFSDFRWKPEQNADIQVGY